MRHPLPFRIIAAALTAIALTACVDTTGLSAASSRPLRGNPQGIVTVVEFGDLQCPSCKAAQTQLVKPLLDKYGSQIQFAFKHFPLRSIHRYALDLAEASECAADQGKFWEFVDMAYDKQDSLGRTSINDWATSLKLDMALFDRCTRSHIKRKTVLADYDEGTAAGVQGTPTFFVQGNKVPSTMQDMSAAIDAAEAQTMKHL